MKTSGASLLLAFIVGLNCKSYFFAVPIRNNVAGEPAQRLRLLLESLQVLGRVLRELLLAILAAEEDVSPVSVCILYTDSDRDSI